MRTNYFKFGSDEKKKEVFDYIKSRLNENLTKIKLSEEVKKEFNIPAHTRTVEGWIDEITLRHLNTRNNILVQKWRKEYQEQKEIVDPLVQLTEEIFDLAKARGLI